MPKSMLACCKIFLSESQNLLTLNRIENVAKLHPNAIILNKFIDLAYNRVAYTIVSRLSNNNSFSSPINQLVLSMVEEAFGCIDLETHCGTHPRLGVVDHICFHPLGESKIDQVVGLAKTLAADIGLRLRVPIFLYGATHEEGRTLASIRRELGYFKPNSQGHKWSSGPRLDLSRFKPDNGPSHVDPARGLVLIGATPWVDNYNVPVRSTNINVVRRIARRVSSRGGGFESVQAMALVHGEDCIEVACNLLEPDRLGADRVQAEIERLGEEVGLVVEPGYHTDFTPEKIIESYLQKLVD